MTAIRFFNEIFNIGFDIGSTIVDDLSDMAVASVSEKYTATYNAELAHPSEVLQRNVNGFHIGKWSVPFSEAHSMIVIGGSGSNKSTSTVATLLLQNHIGSYVVYDPSGEVFKIGSPALKQAGYRILIFDPDHPEISCSFNGLIKSKDESSITTFINVLTRNSLGQAPYDYWAQSGEHQICFWAKFLHRYADKKYVNLANVNYLLKVFLADPALCDALVLRLSQNNQRVLTEYRAIVATPERTLQSTLATARNILRLYDLSQVSLVTSADTFSYEDFRKTKHILFIKSSASKAKTYASLTAGIIEYFISESLSEEPNPHNLPLTLIGEESANLMLPNLGAALSLGRKHSLNTITLWQDYNQIESIYGKHDAANIFANSTIRVFMGCNKPQDTCLMLEKMLGKRTIEIDGGRVVTREILTAQEIRELSKAIVFNGNKRACLVEHDPYFAQQGLRKLARLPAYIPKQHLTHHEPPLIPIE